MRNSILTTFLVATALSGCASPTPFTPPSVVLPSVYANQTPSVSLHTSTTNAQAHGKWWTAFGDSVLDQLVDDVLAHNNDLAVAAIRVRKAQLQAGLAVDTQRPQVTGAAAAEIVRGNDLTPRTYSNSLSTSYELDLWGKLAAESDAARWEARATDQDLDSAAIALAGTTVNLYWQLAFLNESITRADASLAYAGQVQMIVEKQHHAGQVSGIEVSEAEQSLRAQEASRVDLLQQRVETRAALALLLGSSTWTDAREPPKLPNIPLPELAAGLPAQLLSQRPDLRAAELRLRSSLSTVDATRASLYPSIGLTGTLGGSSTALSNVMANPVGMLGAGVTLPFLNWNQGQLNLNVSKADFEIAVVNFRQTLLQAFIDVDNALSAHTQLTARAVSLDQSLAAAARAEQLYGVRYRVGGVPLRAWIDAQETRRAAELAQSQNTLQRLNNHVSLYQALDGDTAPDGAERYDKASQMKPSLEKAA